jgi:hypothetical protein
MAELLVSAALGGMVIGAAAIGLGTLGRVTGRVGETVNVPLTAAQIAAFGIPPAEAPGGVRSTIVAPNVGATGAAEDLRERFFADTTGATAVYCLGRAELNNYHPALIPFNPVSDRLPDTPEQFRSLLVGKSGENPIGETTTTDEVPSGLNTLLATGPNIAPNSRNATIFVLRNHDKVKNLRVKAVYEIDVAQINGSPRGFYASVRRYVKAETADLTAKLTASFDVFYPAFDVAGWPSTTDDFRPLWVAFERVNRMDGAPAASSYRKARERPFYLIWWPDPNAQSLGRYRATNGAYSSTDPRSLYNHMAGRTSYMFAVPMFPGI